MSRLLHRVLAGLLAAALLPALVVVCPCPPAPVAQDHGCCAGDGPGLRAATDDCCLDGAVQARADALQPAAAPLAEPGLSATLVPESLRASAVVRAAAPEPSPPFSRPSILRI